MPLDPSANSASISIDDALTLRDLQERACFVERLLFAWPTDEKGRVTCVPRPTKHNVLNSPASTSKTADDPIIFCRNDDDDAKFLMEQLQRPHDHVAELLRRLQLAFSGRVGHLAPRDQRLLSRQAALWPTENANSDPEILDTVVRFQLCELSLAEVRLVASTALRIVRITQEHVAAAECIRLALAKNELLPNLALPVDRLEETPSWFEFEAPGPANTPWKDGGS